MIELVYFALGAILGFALGVYASIADRKEVIE